MRARGFSLLECLIGLTLALFVVCACLEFFGAAERSYFKLKDKEEAAQSALAALDKMSVDILRAGQGLAQVAGLGVVEPVVESGGGLLITRAEKSYDLAADVAPGDLRVPLADDSELRPGRELCLTDGEKGEVCLVASVEPGAAVVSSPLVNGFAREKTAVLLLEKTFFSLDARQAVIRRRVNLSSAQPLLENAGSAEFLVDRPANLVRVRFSLISEGDAIYELRLFPKNPALAGKG